MVGWHYVNHYMQVAFSVMRLHRLYVCMTRVLLNSMRTGLDRWYSGVMATTMRVQEFGGIKSWWVRLDGRAEVCAGSVHDTPTADGAVALARRIWAAKDAQAAAADAVQARNPGRQVYVEYLPNDESLFTGEPGEYAFVYGDRRKAGRLVVKDCKRIG